MFSQNLIVVKRSIGLLLCLSLFACSSTEQVNNEQLSDNSYAQHYNSSNFPHSQFTPISKHSIKKPLNSDHQLMMSLLNRPMTDDQVMMLAFAQERARYASSYSHYASNAVMIKGDKASDSSSNRTGHAYAQLISQDINSVSISAPQ
jgi:hypothetical protein